MRKIPRLLGQVVPGVTGIPTLTIIVRADRPVSMYLIFYGL